MTEETTPQLSAALDATGAKTGFAPTTGDLRRLWMSRNFANVPEKLEHEAGFETWLAGVQTAAVEAERAMRLEEARATMRRILDEAHDEGDWINALPREVAGCLRDRETEIAKRAARWLHDHESDDEVWELFHKLFDELERITRDELDTTSSATRQHFTDTGRYLTVAEVLEQEALEAGSLSATEQIVAGFRAQMNEL